MVEIEASIIRMLDPGEDPHPLRTKTEKRLPSREEKPLVVFPQQTKAECLKEIPLLRGARKAAAYTVICAKKSLKQIPQQTE